MSAAAEQAWIIRAGRDDEYEKDAFDRGVVGVGWRRVGDLSGVRSLKAVRLRVADAYPDVAARTRETYAIQLHAFRSGVRVGDPVVLLRDSAPEVAVGEVTGEYVHGAGTTAGPPHTRTVRWCREQVRRSELGADLLRAPALTAVYRITNAEAVARLREVAGRDSAPAAEVAPAAPLPTTAADGLARNLAYALSLAEAGGNLEALGVTQFEVTDVYRAAWVQAVAALDHWVHQEVRERLLRLAEEPATQKTSQYEAVTLPLGIVEQVRQGQLSLRDALDRHYLQGEFAFRTFQHPDKIKQAFRQVSEVEQLWRRVATTLSERTGGTSTYSEKDVVDRLKRVVERRNKIAHEYDDDPSELSGKRPIDAAGTMHAIRWIEQVAGAILIVIDKD